MKIFNQDSFSHSGENSSKLAEFVGGVAVIGLPLLSYNLRKKIKTGARNTSFYRAIHQLDKSAIMDGEYSIVIVDMRLGYKVEQLESLNRTLKEANSKITLILLSDMVHNPLVFDDQITRRMADAIIQIPTTADEFTQSVYKVVKSIKKMAEAEPLKPRDLGTLGDAA